MNNMTDWGLSQFEKINKIIYALYNDDLPLYNRTMNFFQMLLEIFYFDRGTILFFYKNEQGIYDKHSSISVNWDREYVQKYYDEHYCHMDDTLPVMDQATSVIFRSTSFFNEERRQETPYWKEYLVPNNCIYSLEGNILIQSSKNLRAGFAFYRGGEKQDFTDENVHVFKLFQPHLSNIFKHYGEETDSTSLMFMLDKYNSVGLGVLDNHYNIIRSNATFDKFTENRSNSSITYKIIHLCKNLNSANSSKITTEYKFEETPIFLEVTKVSDRQKHSDFQFYCMVYDLSYFFNTSLNQMKEKYALTPREFDVVQAVLRGKSNEEVSQELYLSLPTVKKYLTSAYNKMQIKNQKQIFDLLKLV